MSLRWPARLWLPLAIAALTGCNTQAIKAPALSLRLVLDDDVVYSVDEDAQGRYERRCFDEPYYLTARLPMRGADLATIAAQASGSGFFELPADLADLHDAAPAADNNDGTPALARVVTTSHCADSSLSVTLGERQHVVNWDCDTPHADKAAPGAVLPLVRAIARAFARQATVARAPTQHCGYR